MDHTPIRTGIPGLSLTLTRFKKGERYGGTWLVEDQLTWSDRIMLCIKGRWTHYANIPSANIRDMELETVSEGEFSPPYRVAQYMGETDVYTLAHEDSESYCLVHQKRYWPELLGPGQHGPYERRQVVFVYEGTGSINGGPVTAPEFVQIGASKKINLIGVKALRLDENEDRWVDLRSELGL